MSWSRLKRGYLSRRAFLRGSLATGAAVGLALPPLEAMFTTNGALAGGAVLEPIFGIFFWANGLPWNEKHTVSAVPDPSFNPALHVDRWTPATIGSGFAPSPLLAPIAPYGVNVITGLEPKTDWVTPGETDGHMRGFMVALTGDRVNPQGFYHKSHTLTAERATLDQVVANNPQFYANGIPRYKSLVLGISNARFHEYGHWASISYNGPSSLNPPIVDPAHLYNMLFAPPGDTTLLGQRVSVLDAVLEDYKSLRGRLGANDKARIDAHLDNIAEVQRRLSLSTTTCDNAPGQPAPSSDLLQQTRTMAKLLGLGLQCGITRVFSFMLTSPATTHVFNNLPGVINDMHTTCHAGEWELVRSITDYQMQAFAILLEELDALPMSMTESVLDAALVFGTSEYGEGWKHGVQEMPVVLAGRARGRLATSTHVREQGGNMAKAHVTILRGLGLDTPSFGFHGAETDQDFGELLL